MSLNSYSTEDGGEIAFIQAFQAMGSGLKPERWMNPLLLKVTGHGLEVIFYGRSLGVMNTADYYSILPDLWSSVRKAIVNDMVIEGAGGMAEPNFMSRDVTAFLPASELKIPVVLVLDIDRGGAFASAYGAYCMFPPSVRETLRGFIVNKFRGDEKLLEPAVKWLESRTGMKHLGTIPMMGEQLIPPEDSMNLHTIRGGRKDVAVVAFPYISNFNEFHALKYSDATVRFVRRPEELGHPDLVVLPGSRNTAESLTWLRESGLAPLLKRERVLGICGGFQIMGRKLTDHYGLEFGEPRSYEGLGLLDIEVSYGEEKIVSRTRGVGLGLEVEGYEIRRGRVNYLNERPVIEITQRNDERVHDLDGVLHEDKAGYSIHGTLYSEFGSEVMRHFGIKLKVVSERQAYEEEVNTLSRLVSRFLDLDFIEELFNQRV
jgi:adenosylcobyric acid synthase